MKRGARIGWFIGLLSLAFLSWKNFAIHGKLVRDFNSDTLKVVFDSLGRTMYYDEFMPLLKTGNYTIEGINRKRHLVRTSQAKFRFVTTSTDSASINDGVSKLINFMFPKRLLGVTDTNQVMYDEADRPLRYFQYSKIMLSGKYNIVVIKGHKKLKLIHPRLYQDFGIDDPVFANNWLFGALNWADKILVIKSKRKLYIQRNGKTVFEYSINLGRNPVGQKLKEGDGRTPEGSYFIDWQKYDNPLFYRSFHISYPNDQDKQLSKTHGVVPGSNIMIHGTSSDKLKLKDWTNGCIAVQNNVLDTLSKYVPMDTVIEIRP